MSQEIIRSDKSKYLFNKKDLLGRGAYGSVYQGLDQTTKLPVAIKVMGDVKFKKSEEKYVKSAKREVRIFRRVADLPNVIKMIDYIEDEFDIYIVMEFCEGGTLRQLLRSQKGKRFEEADAVKHLKEIATGVFGLHQKNIMHKDLNLENVLLKENKCILADLGSAMRRRISRNFAGAVGYTAPEVHLVNQGKSYNKQVDIWSMGVIFFEMLYTRAVYKDMQKQIVEEASMGVGRFPKEPKVSKNAKDLLNKMLTVDPNQRITIEGIVNHPLLRPEGAPVIKYKEEELREEDEDEEELAEAEQDTRTGEEIAQRKTEKNQKKKLKKKLRKQAKAAQMKEGETEDVEEEEKESEEDDQEEKIEEKKSEKQEKPEIKEEVKYDEINDDGFTTVTTKSKKKKKGK